MGYISVTHKYCKSNHTDSCALIYNVTDMDSKSATEMQDEVSLIGDGFSLIPVALFKDGLNVEGSAWLIISTYMYLLLTFFKCMFMPKHMHP